MAWDISRDSIKHRRIVADTVYIMELPTFETYCPNTTAANALRFDFGPITVWYSYKTPVAFRSNIGAGRLVRENEWGPTTGKHLNAIDGGDKASRIPGSQFETILRDTLRALGSGVTA